jgi:hypothetical protein
MRDVLTVLSAALLGATVPLLLWTAELAIAHFRLTGAPGRVGLPALKGRWLVLAALLALVFAWAACGRLHAALALQLSFVAWALGGSGLAVTAPWLIWRTRWLRWQQGRPFNALGRLVMLLLLESLAATICTEDLRNWSPRSPAASALQSAGAVTSTVLLIVFIALLPLAMLDLLTQRVHPEH